MTGNELKRIRMKSGFSQEMLARMLEISVHTVASWECGRRPINKISEIAVKSVLNNRRKK